MPCNTVWHDPATGDPRPAPRLSHDRRTRRKLGRFEPLVIVFEIDIAVAEATDTTCSGVDNLPELTAFTPNVMDFAAGPRRSAGVEEPGNRQIRSLSEHELSAIPDVRCCPLAPEQTCLDIGGAVQLSR